jgi:hypothetical protein
MPQIISDRSLKSWAKHSPAQAGERFEAIDASHPGFGVRVNDRGGIRFFAIARVSGSSNPVRLSIGTYGEKTDRAARIFTLSDARAEADQWRRQASRGIDPRDEEKRALLEQQRRRKNTFAAVAEDFIRDKLPTERKGREVGRDIRRDLIRLWGPQPISEITARDIREAIREKRRTAPAQARNLLGTVKRLFGWAVDQDAYGLTASPADALKPSKIVGDKVAGQRILSDAELFALWRAADRTPYPYGPAYKQLILTALRLNEVADASRTEFDFTNRLWTIPADRMKGKNSKARPHVVPLTDDILAIIESLPRFKTGEYLFSTTFGASPVWMSDKVKKRIDVRMLRTLRSLARRRGDDPAKVKLPRWTNHDIRRSIRSGLSRLKVTEEAREAVMAHARPGLKGTYDLYDYLDEKREALELWAARLRTIIDPAPNNVVPIVGGRKASR